MVFEWCTHGPFLRISPNEEVSEVVISSRHQYRESLRLKLGPAKSSIDLRLSHTEYDLGN
jgi:hypothetical protein